MILTEKQAMALANTTIIVKGEVSYITSRMETVVVYKENLKEYDVKGNILIIEEDE